MMGQKQPGSGSEEDTTADEEIWLLGQPLLRHYLDFVTDVGMDSATADPMALTDEWRMANDYYHELEQHEAGIADKVECRDVDPALAPLAAEVTTDPWYRRTFDVVPPSFGMVELDRLIVWQKHVSRNFLKAFEARLGPAPDVVTLFRFCLPRGLPPAPVQIRQVGSRRYVFRSDSTDLRFHEPVVLRPDQIRDYNTFGPVAGVVGLVVGFSSNFLNAIRVGNRLLVHNGYHRACALRARGITHAPCIIQPVTRPDELGMTANRVVVADPDFYFNTARPPLLKDFFDAKIGQVLRIHKRVRTIEVNFEVRDDVLPE